MMNNKSIPVIKLPGRAQTPEQKKAVLDKLYQAWCDCPELRLGQLVDNAMCLYRGASQPNLFNVEDTFLIEIIEEFVNKI